jgi:hypothetical protein
LYHRAVCVFALRLRLLTPPLSFNLGAASVPPHPANVPSVALPSPVGRRRGGSGGACRGSLPAPAPVARLNGEGFGTYRSRNGRCFSAVGRAVRNVRKLSVGSCGHYPRFPYGKQAKSGTISVIHKVYYAT